MQNVGLVMSNDQLAKQEHDLGQHNRRVNELVAGESTQKIENELVSYINRQWELAWRAKQPVERRMLKALRALNGRYTDAKAAEIRGQGLPLIWMSITSVKCRAAHSWIRDVLMPAGDKPWEMTPTPMPVLPPDVQQEVDARVKRDAFEFVQATGNMLTAEQVDLVHQMYIDKVREVLKERAMKAADSMSDMIEDQLTEGGWTQEFDDVLADLVQFPAAIIKGPVLRKKKRLSWAVGQASSVAVRDEIVPMVERVDPFMAFPVPGGTQIDDNDFIQLHQWRKGDIYAMIGLPGFNEQAIRAALQEGGAMSGPASMHANNLRQQLKSARGETSTLAEEDGYIFGLEFWGQIQGRLLASWGMNPASISDLDAMYDVTATMVGRHVVGIRFNPDPLGRKPYSKACFEKIAGAFWGRSVPEMIEDCQDSCNAAARALLANMGIASGPQVAVNTGSVPPGEDVTNIYPWKIWQLDYSKTGGSSRPPIDFFQPSPMTESLLKVFEHFSRLADEYSGIPAYTYGAQGNIAGAARTASGLSMLMNAASKAIKNVIKQVDVGIIQTLLERYYAYNMVYSQDPSIKGDIQIKARGALSLVSKEQNQARLQELLGITANPIDMKILGLEGRAQLWRRALHGVDVGADDVIPDKEELRQQMINEMANQAGAQGGQNALRTRNDMNAAGEPMGGGNA